MTTDELLKLRSGYRSRAPSPVNLGSLCDQRPRLLRVDCIVAGLKLIEVSG